MTPQEITNVVRELNEIRDIANADIEKVVGYNTRLQADLDEARAEVERLNKEVDYWKAETHRVAKSRDEALDEVEQLKQALQPSRLEIAAMLLCHEWCLDAEMALEEADLLIAKAKHNEATA